MIYYGGSNGQHNNWRESSLNLVSLDIDRFAGFVPRDKRKKALLTTVPLRLDDDMITINAEIATGGSVRAALLDGAGLSLAGYALEDSLPLETGGIVVRTALEGPATGLAGLASPCAWFSLWIMPRFTPSRARPGFRIRRCRPASMHLRAIHRIAPTNSKIDEQGRDPPGRRCQLQNRRTRAIHRIAPTVTKETNMGGPPGRPYQLQNRRTRAIHRIAPTVTKETNMGGPPGRPCQHQNRRIRVIHRIAPTVTKETNMGYSPHQTRTIAKVFPYDKVFL